MKAGRNRGKGEMQKFQLNSKILFYQANSRVVLQKAALFLHGVTIYVHQYKSRTNSAVRAAGLVLLWKTNGAFGRQREFKVLLKRVFLYTAYA